MTNTNTTKGELAKALLELKKSAGKNQIAELIKLIENQEDFLKTMASQSKRALYRQLLKLSEDFLPSKDSIDEAEEAKVITKELAKNLKDNFDALESSFLIHKTEKLGYLMAAPSNGTGFISYLTKSLTDFNTFVQTAGDSSRQVKNQIRFDVKFNSRLPEHRVEQTIIDLLVFDFYSLQGIKVENGEETEKIKFIPFNEAEKHNLKADVKTTYDDKKHVLNVEIKTLNIDDNMPNTQVSLMINQHETSKRFMTAFEKQYLINSAVLIEDFASETSLIDSLYIRPLAALLEQTLDTQLVSDASAIRKMTMEVKKSITEARDASYEENTKNPLLEAYLAIVEDGTDATQNKGETTSRISKAEVLAKLYQGNNERYEANISMNYPTQVELDRRFSVVRVEIDKEVIDFIIFEFGLNKQKIWLPIDKTFIAKEAAVNTWMTFGKGGQKEIRASNKKDDKIEQLYVSISSDKVNPQID